MSTEADYLADGRQGMAFFCSFTGHLNSWLPAATDGDVEHAIFQAWASDNESWKRTAAVMCGEMRKRGVSREQLETRFAGASRCLNPEP
jgi:hypothetical protein